MKMSGKLLYNGNKLDLEYFKELMEVNVWKAFATIHSGIHHQMKIILLYHSKGNRNRDFFKHYRKRWKIIKRKMFHPLLNDLFVCGIINDNLHQEIADFNTNRNRKLGHINIYEKVEVPDKQIRTLCERGVKISKELDKILSSVLFSKK